MHSLLCALTNNAICSFGLRREALTWLFFRYFEAPRNFCSLVVQAFLNIWKASVTWNILTRNTCYQQNSPLVCGQPNQAMQVFRKLTYNTRVFYRNLLDFVRRHDEIAHQIALRGRQFIWEHLRGKDILCYWKLLLNKYSSLLNFKPILEGNEIEIT